MTFLPDLSKLTSAEKDALILAQAAQLRAALARIEALEKQLERLLAPPKTPDNSSLPPSKGQKPNRPDKPSGSGPRQGSLGRKGGGRARTAHPDEVVAHQLRDCQYAIDAGDAVFAPRMKALLLRAAVIARRHQALAESTRRSYRWRLERDLDAVMMLAPTTKDGRRLRRRYGKVRSHLFTFLDHPEITGQQQQQRARTAAHRYLPQSHRRLPFGLGRQGCSTL